MEILCGSGKGLFVYKKIEHTHTHSFGGDEGRPTSSKNSSLVYFTVVRKRNIYFRTIKACTFGRSKLLRKKNIFIQDYDVGNFVTSA